jgi:hypothetical protein
MPKSLKSQKTGLPRFLAGSSCGVPAHEHSRVANFVAGQTRRLYFVQVPLTQNWNEAQGFPQPPQLFGSVSASTHAPDHDVSFAGHAIDGGKPHSPPMHW